MYMVFPYMDHDLAGLLENERVKLTPSQIKLYMKQLLEGTEYMHRVGIVSALFVRYADATTSAEPHSASRYESGEPAHLERRMSEDCRLRSGPCVRSEYCSDEGRCAR